MPHESITSHAEMEAVLATALTGCLGTVGLDGQPYVTPHNYLYYEGRIYIHSALDGRKLEHLNRDPRVCFTVWIIDRLVFGEQACDCAVRYRSVMAFGHAHLIHDQRRRREILTELTARYMSQPVEPPPAARVAGTAVIEIIVDELSGKRNVDKDQLGLH